MMKKCCVWIAVMLMVTFGSAFAAGNEGYQMATLANETNCSNHIVEEIGPNGKEGWYFDNDTYHKYLVFYRVVCYNCEYEGEIAHRIFYETHSWHNENVGHLEGSLKHWYRKTCMDCDYFEDMFWNCPGSIDGGCEVPWLKVEDGDLSVE